MNCKKCGAYLPDGTLICTNCGQPADGSQSEEYRRWSKKTNKAFIIIMVIILVLGLVTHDLFHVRSRSSSYDYDDGYYYDPYVPEPNGEDYSDGQTVTAPGISMDHVMGVSATSYLDEPQYELSHRPENIIDGTLVNAWVEGVDGYGYGESVTMTFDGTYSVSGMCINSGYQKSDSHYSSNSRPKAMTVRFSDGQTFSFELDDYYGTQTIIFDHTVVSGSISFIINSVYEGDIYEDTVISEISVF